MLKTSKRNEYELTAVPYSQRRSLIANILVWAGFPLVVTGAFLGGQITLALGFKAAVTATLIGNLVLMIYVGLLSVIGSRSGQSFNLISKHVFGQQFSKWVSGFLSILVLGWFSVQTGMAGQGLEDMLGWSAAATSLCLGFIFVGLSLLGIKALTYIGAASVPFFLIIALIALYYILKSSDISSISNYTGQPTAAWMSISIAITLVISLFIDSGTLTADFSRWTRSSQHALIATACAFPLANSLAMLLGIFTVASSMSQDGNFAALVAQHAPSLVIVTAMFFILNCASVTMHCLYNAATGCSGILRQPYWIMCLIFGTIATLIAFFGVWDYLTQWLNFLGVLVPGIGGVVISAMIMQPESKALPFAKIAFYSWLISILVASLATYYVSSISIAVLAMVVGAVAYQLLKYSYIQFSKEFA